MKAWHFLRTTPEYPAGVLRDSTPAPADGEVLRVNGQLEMCYHGLHFSINALDALSYAPGLLICRVDIPDSARVENDKGVASRRTIDWRADATDAVVGWAQWCADEVSHLTTDPRAAAQAAAWAPQAAARAAQNIELTRRLEALKP